MLNVAFSLSGLTAGGLLGGLVLSLLFRGKQRPAWPLMIGMVLSLIVVFCDKTYAGDFIAWPWFNLIGLVTTMLVCMGGMLVSRQRFGQLSISLDGKVSQEHFALNTFMLHAPESACVR